MERDTAMEGGEKGKGGRRETDRQRQREEQSVSETDQTDQNTDDHKVILIAKMCISMYKKTNAFLPLSMIFENQLRLRNVY